MLCILYVALGACVIFFFMETSGAGNLGINDLGPLV